MFRALILALLLVPQAFAQQRPYWTMGIGAMDSANSSINSTCSLVTPPPPPAGVVYLGSGGNVVTCVGTWTDWAFGINLGATAPVSMTGADVTLYTASLPALSVGKCFAIAYSITSGLNGASVTVAIDGTVIFEPLLSITNVDIWNSAIYCNASGSQATQTLVYGVQPTFNFANPNGSGSPSWVLNNQLALSHTSNGAVLTTPTAIDWSMGHTLTVVANQPSGTITPQYLRVTENFN